MSPTPINPKRLTHTICHLAKDITKTPGKMEPHTIQGIKHSLGQLEKLGIKGSKGRDPFDTKLQIQLFNALTKLKHCEMLHNERALHKQIGNIHSIIEKKIFVSLSKEASASPNKVPKEMVEHVSSPIDASSPKTLSLPLDQQLTTYAHTSKAAKKQVDDYYQDVEHLNLQGLKGSKEQKTSFLTKFKQLIQKDQHTCSDYLKQIFQKVKGKKIKSLHVKHRKDLSIHDWQLIIDKCPNLEIVNVSYTNINGKALAHMCSKLRHLQHLNIAFCQHIQSSEMRQIFKSKTLQVLHIEHRSLGFKTWDLIHMQMPNLKEISTSDGTFHKSSKGQFIKK